MGKKILVGVTILLIAGLFVGWYLFTAESKYLGTSAFRAVPEDAPVTVRIHHLLNYTSGSINNPFWKTFSAFPGASVLYRHLGIADSILNLTSKPNKAFTDKDLTIAFENENDHFKWLLLIELSSLTEKRDLNDLIGRFLILPGVTTKKIRSGSAELTCYTPKVASSTNSYFTTIFHGLFLGSTDIDMITKAIMQLENKELPGNSVFEKVNKSATKNIDVNIYLNHRKLTQFARQLFSETFLALLKEQAPLADYSEIDLTQKSDELILNGFSFTGDSLNTQLGIFRNQKTDSFNLARVFPKESTFFLGYVISDNSIFFDDYQKLLGRTLQLENYHKSLAKTDSLYGIDLLNIVKENLAGTASMVFARFDSVMPEENKYLVMQVKNGSQMEEALSPLEILIPGHGKRDKPQNYIPYQMDQETIFKIHQTALNDFGKQVFGNAFADVATNYFAVYNNILIMGASAESLERFLRSEVLQQTLGNNQTYNRFTSGLSDRMNIYLWSSPGRSLPFFKEMFNSETFQKIEKKRETLSKIESVGWQIGNENGVSYNMARLKLNSDRYENPTSISWKRNLGNQVINVPFLVINPFDKPGREMIIQDGGSHLMLITDDGRILWKIKLKSPVRSEIFQLDCFRNGKLQFLFSTTEALHLIDHNGNYLPHFPVLLKTPATNGVSVFDYDHTRDYRFFIACKDHKVYLFDKKGKAVTGWIPPKTGHNVLQPVQFFRVENKDYLVFTDKSNGYILDRKGKTVVTIKANLTFSGNPFTMQPKSGKNRAHIITTDVKGNIVSIGFDGSVKKMTTEKFSDKHYFLCINPDADNQPGYLFLDGDSLVVYDLQPKRVFARKFNHPIAFPPEIFTFPDKSLKIGITDSSENKIYLLNNDGSDYKGFPIEGNSPFTLGFSGSENCRFNLITGTAERFLSIYQIR